MKLVNDSKKNKDYKMIFHKTLLVLSSFIDYNKIEKWRLKELFQNLITGGDLLDNIESLESFMICTEKINSSSYGGSDQIIIVNPLAFESYIFCIKKYICNMMIAKTKRKDVDLIRSSFTLLKNISLSTKESNKYYIGKSNCLIELVEFFADQDIKCNKLDIMNETVDSLLECLENSLPYHTDPAIFKRYMKIITNLTYGIRESTGDIDCTFLGKYLRMFQNIIRNDHSIYSSAKTI